MSDYEDHSSSSPGEGDLLIALCSFNGEGPDQLSMVSRDVVRVIESNEDGWYKVRRLTDDRVGLAPRKILASHTTFLELHSGDDAITVAGTLGYAAPPPAFSASPINEKAPYTLPLGRQFDNESLRRTMTSLSHPITYPADFKLPPPAADDESILPAAPTVPGAAYAQSVAQDSPPQCPPFNEVPPACEERVDMLGEELSNESSVWPIYVSTAADFDTEMIDGWNKNLDVLLLFASLFSAVVTSFVVQSTALLQADYGQINALLTAHILIAVTNTSASWMSSIPPPETILMYQTPGVAQVVNIIWFAALGLSLSAVLVAMLAKQWLTAYLLESKADPHQKACERQRRYDGMHRWSLPYVMVALPAVLHVSLFLFLTGLIVYIWQLDPAVSAALCVILALLCCVYIFTGFTAMVNPECPYITPTTSYLKSHVSRYLHLFQPLKRKCTPTSDELLVTRAVMWLATARNSASASAALQSMAGLRRGFIGYDTAQAANIAKLALERLRNCFSSDWRYQDTASYTIRDEKSLFHASCYARTLMSFVDDPRCTRPSDFAGVLADSALPVLLQILGSSANSNYAMLGLCDYQRLLHRQEVERFYSVRKRDGTYDSQQAGEVIRAKPSVENMRRIVQLLSKHLDGTVFLHGVAIEIAIETLGFAPLAWICAVSEHEDLSMEDILLPLLRIRKETKEDVTGIRLALASTFSILTAVHQSEQLPDPADDLCLKFEAALAAASAVRHDGDISCARTTLLRSISYLICNHTSPSGMVSLLYKEFCKECDADSATQGADFSDKVAVQSLLPLLLVPSLEHEEKTDIATRIQALALSAVSGFDIPTNSIYFNITPRDPFPMDAINTLITVLYQHKELTPSWLRFVSTAIHLITQSTIHRQRLFTEAPTIMELICESASVEVASDLFWTFTSFLQQAVRSSDRTTVVMLASAGALSTLEHYRARIGLTPEDVVAWVDILPSLPIVSTETMSRMDLILSMCAGVETQGEEDTHHMAQSIREPLLQFSPSLSTSIAPQENGEFASSLRTAMSPSQSPMVYLPASSLRTAVSPSQSPMIHLASHYVASMSTLPAYMSQANSPMPSTSWSPAPSAGSPMPSLPSYRSPSSGPPAYRSARPEFPTSHLSPIMSTGRSISSSSREPLLPISNLPQSIQGSSTSANADDVYDLARSSPSVTSSPV